MVETSDRTNVGPRRFRSYFIVKEVKSIMLGVCIQYSQFCYGRDFNVEPHLFGSYFIVKEVKSITIVCM